MVAPGPKTCHEGLGKFWVRVGVDEVGFHFGDSLCSNFVGSLTVADDDMFRCFAGVEAAWAGAGGFTAGF